MNIWIESETTSTIIGGSKYANDNTDVIVTFDDNIKYVATFFTYDNIKHLREKNKETGECLNGKYFWASDMFIIETTDRLTIEQTIKHLIEKDEFKHIFRRIE